MIRIGGETSKRMLVGWATKVTYTTEPKMVPEYHVAEVDMCGAVVEQRKVDGTGWGEDAQQRQHPKSRGRQQTRHHE